MQIKKMTGKTNTIVLDDTTVSSSEERSWAISHLPLLNHSEYNSIIDLLSCWFEQRQWHVAEECDVNLLWEYAERHGFSGIIGSLALRGLVTNQALVSLGKNRYFTNVLYHEKCMKICRDLQHKAIEMKIPIAFIKGPTLDLIAFQEPGIRSYSDLDVVVKSRDDAWEFINALNCYCSEGKTEDDLKNRLMESGRVHATYNGWSIEFCYPIKWSCEPMFDLFLRHKDRFMTVPDSVKELAMPDPELHLIILIQHAARHLCSRFIWFLDIAALLRSCGDQIDIDRVMYELEKLQMKDVFSVIANFCKTYIDKDFPVIEQESQKWNTQFQEKMASPTHILSQISLFHESGWRQKFTYLLSPSRFFLITDANHHAFYKKSIASRWLAARVMHIFQLENRCIYWLLKFLTQLIGCPFCFMVAIISTTGGMKEVSVMNNT